MSHNLFLGTDLKTFLANGSREIPALATLIEATWTAVRLFMPCFMRMKELPQMNDNMMNSNHFDVPFSNSSAFGKYLFLASGALLRAKEFYLYPGFD